MSFKKMILPAVLMVSVLSMAALPALANHQESGKSCPISGGHGKGDCGKGGCGKRGASGDCGKKSGCPIAAKFCMKACWLMAHKDELGLTEEQVAKVETLQFEMKKNAIRGAAEMKIGMMELEKKLSQDPLNVEEIESMIDSGMAGMATGAKANIKAYADLKSVLTEEQKATAKTLKTSGHGSHAHQS